MELQLSPKGQTYRGVARAIKVIVAAIVIVSIVVLARIVLIFFGQLKTMIGYQFIVDLSGVMTAPFSSVGTVATPYSGVFDIGATVLLMLLIFFEFILSGIAGFFNRRALSEVVGREQPQTPNVQVMVAPNFTGVPDSFASEPTVDQTPPALDAEDINAGEEAVGDEKSK